MHCSEIYTETQELPQRQPKIKSKKQRPRSFSFVELEPRSCKCEVIERIQVALILRILLGSKPYVTSFEVFRVLFSDFFALISVLILKISLAYSSGFSLLQDSYQHSIGCMLNFTSAI